MKFLMGRGWGSIKYYTSIKQEFCNAKMNFITFHFTLSSLRLPLISAGEAGWTTDGLRYW